MSRRRAHDEDDGYERAYRKRRRVSENQEIEDRLESLILRVGEKSTSSLESNLEGLASVLEADIATFRTKILRILSDCAVRMPEKCTIYTTLVGLLNAKNYNFGGEFVEHMVRSLKEALKSCKWDAARYLLRFLADLVNCHVISAGSLLQLLDNLIDTAKEDAVPQVRKDWYVFAVLATLPWVGRELYEKKEQALELLLVSIEVFLGKRGKKHHGALRVWACDTPHPQEEYLDCLWAQICKLRQDNWAEKHIPRPYLAFDSILCEALQHNLPVILPPPHHDTYGYPMPHVVFRMFDYTDCPEGPFLPGAHSIERFLIEEHLHQIIEMHHLERKDWSSRESYGDDAVGYVQLFHQSGICTIKCRMFPEHKVRAKCYSVTLVVDENNSDIISCQCHDCAASAGGCKHAVAFLMWVHRRSEEPSCTSVECYWKKPTLSQVGTSLKFITVDQLTKKETVCYTSPNALLSEFHKEAKKRKLENCELLKYQPDYAHRDIKRFSLHYFILKEHNNANNDVNKLLELMKVQLDENDLCLIEQATRTQSKNHLWYELRYGRITASRAYEVSHCKTTDGTLVAAIMGAKTPDTKAMKRGRILETSVCRTVEGELKKKIKSCGLFLSREYPMIAATPDGIMNDAIIEIKFPTSDTTKINYIKNGQITPKYLAQVQLQMYTSKMKKCYFCVAHPDFEQSHHVDITLVSYDSEYVSELLNSLSIFWINHIYPILSRTIDM